MMGSPAACASDARESARTPGPAAARPERRQEVSPSDPCASLCPDFVRRRLARVRLPRPPARSRRGHHARRSRTAADGRGPRACRPCRPSRRPDARRRRWRPSTSRPATASNSSRANRWCRTRSPSTGIPRAACGSSRCRASCPTSPPPANTIRSAASSCSRTRTATAAWTAAPSSPTDWCWRAA